MTTTLSQQRMRMLRHRHPLCSRHKRSTTARIMNYLHAKCWIFWMLYSIGQQHHVTNGEIILRVDPLALLSATLRTYQKVACDTDQVVIACPRGTSISIEFAQYNKFIAKDGITIEELCPMNSDAVQMRSKSKHLLRGSIFGSPTQKVPANRYANGGYGLPSYAVETSSTSTGVTTTSGVTANSTDDNADDNTPENCMWPNALQYSLLQTVVEACQKKKHCKFNGSPQYYGLGASGVGDASGTSSYHSSTASSSAISVDPCPKRRKIVEIAYKCRPYEFRSKVACHNDVAQLECNPYSRIAVYSASFGRTEYESIQCPQPQGVKEETCLASYATETVMQICHGRRRCNLAADANTFGKPCQKNSRMYLKVVYTCVPKQVLKDRYESDIEPDEPEDFEGDFNELYDDELFYKESEAIPKLYSNTTVSAGHNSNNATNAVTNNYGINASIPLDAEGGVNPVMTHSSDLSLEDDQDRLYLYLLIAGSAGVIICIIIVAARLFVLKRYGTGTDTHSNSSTKGGAEGGGGAGAETTIPNGFNDTISEIDADIDMTTPIPVPSVSKNENYITYGPNSSLYGSLGPTNVSHTSSTLLLQSSAAPAVVGGSGPPSLIANPLLCSGPRQSPDIIGISTNSFVSQGMAASSSVVENTGIMDHVMTPAIVIGSGMAVCSSSSGNSNAIGTVVPLTSLAQYTTAPTFRAGYIISPEGALQRPTSVQTPPTTSSMVNSIGGVGINVNTLYTNTQLQQMQQQQQHQQQQQQQPLPAISTLRRPRATPSPPVILQQQQSSYDGTAPRTLSTGLSTNSQFYYG